MLGGVHLPLSHYILVVCKIWATAWKNLRTNGWILLRISIWSSVPSEWIGGTSPDHDFGLDDDQALQVHLIVVRMKFVKVRQNSCWRFCRLMTSRLVTTRFRSVPRAHAAWSVVRKAQECLEH